MIVVFVVFCLVSVIVSGQECENYEEYSSLEEGCELNCYNPLGGCTFKMPEGEGACRCARGLYRKDSTGECVKMDDCYDYSDESDNNSNSVK